MDVPGGVRLVFQLTPMQQLVRLVVEGNVALSDEEIREASGLRSARRWIRTAWTGARGRRARPTSRKGYDQAQVNGVRGALARRRGAGVHRWTRASPPGVGRVTLTGSPGLPLSALLDTLGLKPGAVLDQARLDAGLERLRALLRAASTITGAPGGGAHGDGGGRRGDGGAAACPPGLATASTSTATTSFPERVLERVLAYDGAEPLDRGDVERWRGGWTVFYRYRGFHDVRVSRARCAGPDRAEAVLAFEIEEGHPLAVTEVRFQGNQALPSGVLREMLAESSAPRAAARADAAA